MKIKKFNISLAIALSFAIALCSCHTAAAVATIADQAVADKIKTNAADSSKSEPVQQSNVTNNTINNSPVISPVFNNNPVINNSNVNNTVVNINNAPQGTKVEQSENGVNIQIPEVPQPEAEQAGKGGIYLEVNETILGSKSGVIKRKLEELLSQNNCRVEPEANGNLTLKVQAKDCKHRGDAISYCSSCVEIDLIGSRNKKDDIKTSIAEEASFVSKEGACEEAAKDAASEIWKEVKDKIKEVCN